MPSTKKTPATVNSVVKSDSIELNTARSIDLDPQDWYWATWRNLPPLQRPEPQPFDLQDCLKRLGKVKNWDWSKAEIAPSLSRAEAHFWCCAIAESKLVKLKDLVKILAKQSFDGNISIELAKRTCPPQSSPHHHYHISEIFPLINLLTTEELISFADNTGQESLVSIVEGFRVCILPYLTPAQIESWKSHFRSRLDPSRWSAGANLEVPPEFFFAAYLGMHDELLPLVESWADDAFSYPDRAYLAYYQKPQEIIFGLNHRDLVERQMRRLDLYLQVTHHTWQAAMYIRAWLAHTEYSALDLVYNSVLRAGSKELAAELLTAFALVKAPEVAPFMLESISYSLAPQVAKKWLQDNPGHAIPGLIPVAAARGQFADKAVEFLLSMKRKGYADYIQTCLERVSPEIATQIRSTVLDIEEKSYIPFNDLTTPEWLQNALAEFVPEVNKLLNWTIDPIDLPPIACGEYCLNDRQIAIVLNALRQSGLNRPNPLVVAIKNNVNIAELDVFAWKLFEAWRAEGSPSHEKWATIAIGFLGNDGCVMKLAPLIRIWPGVSKHNQAVLGLLCLQAIGTDVALMQIHSIAQKVKYQGIKQRAQECMESIAKQRNMSREQLEDRIVPDCDLDDRGTRLFDFGTRQFWLVLGANLKPMVKDAEGKIKSDLPKPNSKDDRERAEAAIAEWKALKKQIVEVFKMQPARLERAMIAGRRWQVDEFTNLLVRHPLMTNLAQRIVWGGYDAAGRLILTLRVTEDFTYANDRDETCQLTGLDRIGIVHPLHLSPELRANWGEIASDYEIISPFPQLGRSICQLEAGEATQTEITRFKDAKVPALALVGILDKSGWVRGTPQDGGFFTEHFKSFPSANITAVVEYEGVPIGYMESAEEQSIERCYFLAGTQTTYICTDRTKAIALGEIDPVVMSEAIRDLIAIASKSQSAH